MAFNCEYPTTHMPVSGLPFDPAYDYISTATLSMYSDGYLYGIVYGNDIKLYRWPWPDLDTYEVISTLSPGTFGTGSFDLCVSATHAFFLLYTGTNNSDPLRTRKLMKAEIATGTVSEVATLPLGAVTPFSSDEGYWSPIIVNDELFLPAYLADISQNVSTGLFHFSDPSNSGSYVYRELSNGPENGTLIHLDVGSKPVASDNGTIWMNAYDDPSYTDGIGIVRYDIGSDTWDPVSGALDWRLAPGRDGKIYGATYSPNARVIINEDLSISADLSPTSSIRPSTSSGFWTSDHLIQGFVGDNGFLMVTECQPPTPLIPSFVAKFSGLTESLFAGSDSEQNDLDGPALTARFTNLTDAAFTWDSIQRKQLNTGNRFYVLDSSKIKLVHSCEENIVVAEPSDIMNLGIIATDGIAVMPAGDAIWIRNGSTAIEYTLPGLSATGRSLSSVGGEITITTDGTWLYWIEGGSPGYKIHRRLLNGTGTTEQIFEANSSYPTVLGLAWSWFDDRLYFFQYDNNTYILIWVDPDTLDEWYPDFSTGAVTHGAPCLTSDGAAWYRKNGKIRRIDLTTESYVDSIATYSGVGMALAGPLVVTPGDGLVIGPSVNNTVATAGSPYDLTPVYTSHSQDWSVVVGVFGNSLWLLGA